MVSLTYNALHNTTHPGDPKNLTNSAYTRYLRIFIVLIVYAAAVIQGCDSQGNLSPVRVQ